MSVVATTLLLEVTPAAAEDGTLTTLLLDVRPSTTTPPHLLFDVTQTVGAMAQLQPAGTGVLQTTLPKATYTIRDADHVFYPSDFAGGEMTLQMTPDGSSWRWAFEDQHSSSTRTSWVSPTVGWPVEWGTVAPGISPVAFSMRYRTAGLEWFEVPLLAEGVTKSNSSDLLQLSCEGVGPEGRWDRAKVSLFLDAEHGWTHGQIAKYLLANAHDPDGNLVIASTKISFGNEIGAALSNPIDLDCVPAWEAAKRVLDQANYQLAAGAATDGTATVVALPKAPIGEPSVFTLDEGDFFAEGFEIDSVSADHPTCIVVTSNAVDNSNADGSVTSTTIELIFDTFAVDGAYFVQSIGSFAAVSGVAGPLGSPVLQLKERRTTRRTVLDGCEIRVEELVEGYRNVEAARYQVSAAATDLQYAKISGTLYVKDSGAADLDSAPAYLWRYDRWTVLSWTIRQTGGLSEREPYAGRLPHWVNEAFHPGQREPSFTFTDPSDGIEKTILLPLLPIRDFPVGRQLHELVFEGGWQNPAVALKQRANEGLTWEAQDYINSTRMAGSLNGVVLSHERFFADVASASGSAAGGLSDIYKLVYGLTLTQAAQWDLAPIDSYSPADYERWVKVTLLSREYVEGGLTDEDEGGYLTREVEGEQAWDRFPGSRFLYGDGLEGRDYSARSHLIPAARDVRYQAVGNTGHNVTETEFLVNGDLKPDFPKQHLGLAGYLPAMPVCNRDLAARNNLVPLRVKVCLNPDEAIYIGDEDEIAADYIETEAGLEDYAVRLLRELTAIGVAGSLPVDVRLTPLKPGTFNFPRRGYVSRRCWVEPSEIRVSTGPNGLISIMTIALKVAVV